MTLTPPPPTALNGRGYRRSFAFRAEQKFSKRSKVTLKLTHYVAMISRPSVSADADETEINKAAQVEFWPTQLFRKCFQEDMLGRGLKESSTWEMCLPTWAYLAMTNYDVLNDTAGSVHAKVVYIKI